MRGGGRPVSFHACILSRRFCRRARCSRMRSDCGAWALEGFIAAALEAGAGPAPAGGLGCLGGCFQSLGGRSVPPWLARYRAHTAHSQRTVLVLEGVTVLFSLTQDRACVQPQLRQTLASDAMSTVAAGTGGFPAAGSALWSGSGLVSTGSGSRRVGSCSSVARPGGAARQEPGPAATAESSGSSSAKSLSLSVAEESDLVSTGSNASSSLSVFRRRLVTADASSVGGRHYLSRSMLRHAPFLNQASLQAQPHYLDPLHRCRRARSSSWPSCWPVRRRAPAAL